jgi:hypothetical protein
MAGIRFGNTIFGGCYFAFKGTGEIYGKGAESGPYTFDYQCKF